MAKATKGGANKSQAIRDHMAKNPSDGPIAVAEALKKQGIKVSAAFVSTVKSMDKRKSDPSRRRGGELSVDSLMQAKKLAQQMGGVDHAKRALDALSKLSE